MQQENKQDKFQGSNVKPPRAKMLLFTVVFVLLCAGVYLAIRREEALAPEEPLVNMEIPVNQEPNVNGEVLEEKSIVLESPVKESVISSPLKLMGKARGTWYFEASFPVVLVDWDGRIIAESYAEAKDNWMTEDFVPFEATLEFTSPYPVGGQDFMKRGAIILQRDIPSGIPPESDDAIEIPILFSE